MQKNEVYQAFEILLEEIEQVVNGLNQEGAEAFKRNDYEGARRTIEIATRLTEFREKIKTLGQEWQNIFVPSLSAGKSTSKTREEKSKKKFKPLRKGLRTPENAFRIPILESLVELGGRAPMGLVLEKVKDKMERVLNEYDYFPLQSNPSSQRWKNTAQWCRNSLVREGLLKDDSPWGIWEISEKGEKYLKENIEK